jgi:hypothetical protein
MFLRYFLNLTLSLIFPSLIFFISLSFFHFFFLFFFALIKAFFKQSYSSNFNTLSARMADQDNRIRITKFDGTDFSLWKDKIINAMKASDCDETIKTEFKLEGDENVLRAFVKKDEKAKLILMSSIQDNILRKFPRKTA